MYLLACFALLGAVFASPLVTQAPEIRNTDPDLYVLPTDTYPTFYDVQLFLNPDNVNYFTGKVSIRILSNIVTDLVVLQAMEMDIVTVRVSSDIAPTVDIFSSYTLATDDTHFLRINLSENMVPSSPYTIEIDYIGHFAENMFGVYVSTYEENGTARSVITSQLQPTFARRAFPCYDEPALKAIFRTTIYAPATYPIVRSNTVIRSFSLKPTIDGWVKHEFEDTLVMSTYLLAYLVSNFEYIDNSNDPIYHIPFRVYSRPGTQANAAFALDFGQKNMVALENYTEFSYAFPKLDKVAVPDFAAGAMENWGLVIYREAALLVQEGVTTTATRQNIGRIICHENVHQWFGNEVGPLSWTYTWLNEGFANFFENYATDLVLPEWRMMDQFVVALQNVFQFDAVLSVNPMTHAVYTPSEILGTFNSVAYQKSGSVIRMMQHILTPEVFRQGLAIYIRDNSRRAAGPNNLYEGLQQALTESNHSIQYTVTTILNRWTNQGGFPVVTLRRSAATANSVVATQRRYLTDPSQSSTDQWHIPLNWVLSTNPDFSDTRPDNWLYPTTIALSFDISGLANADWYLCNKQQTGYYRVNYDEQNWAALARVLYTDHSIIHTLNRAQILDDAFNLARTGNLAYEYAFDVSRYLVQEKDYIPWAAANPAFTYLDLALEGTEAHELFKTYLLDLSSSLYSELGFDVIPGEEHVTAYHRNIILDINCRHGNQHCIQTAQGLLEQFSNNPTNRLNPDIQTTVYCSGLRGGDVDNFNFLWNLYQQTDDSGEHTILLNALGCTSNTERRNFYLYQVLDDNSQVRQQDKHNIIVSVINSSPENMEAALDFVIAEWPNIQPRVQGLTGTTNILQAFSRRLTTPAHQAKFEEFVDTHQNIFSAGEVAMSAAVQENIGAAIQWSENNVESVLSWLQSTYGVDDNNAPALTAGFTIVLSLFIAVFQY